MKKLLIIIGVLIAIGMVVQIITTLVKSSDPTPSGLTASEPTEKELLFYAKYVLQNYTDSPELSGDVEYYAKDGVYMVSGSFLVDGEVKTKHSFGIVIKNSDGNYSTVKLLIDDQQMYP